MAMPDTDRYLDLMSPIIGLTGMSLDAVNQAFKYIRVENIGILVINRYRESFHIKPGDHVHWSKGELQGI